MRKGFQKIRSWCHLELVNLVQTLSRSNNVKKLQEKPMIALPISVSATLQARSFVKHILVLVILLIDDQFKKPCLVYKIITGGGWSRSGSSFFLALVHKLNQSGPSDVYSMLENIQELFMHDFKLSNGGNPSDQVSFVIPNLSLLARF